jgi:hypothetical protein
MKSYLLSSVFPEWCRVAKIKIERIISTLEELQIGEQIPHYHWCTASFLIRRLGHHIVSHNWNNDPQLCEIGREKLDQQLRSIDISWHYITIYIPHEWLAITVTQRQRDIPPLLRHLKSMLELIQ